MIISWGDQGLGGVIRDWGAVNEHGVIRNWGDQKLG